MDALESRIARLEQSNKRLRFLVGGVAILFAVILGVAVIPDVVAVPEAKAAALAADGKEVIERLRVRRLEIIDRADKVGISLAASFGGPEIRMDNHKGNNILLLVADTGVFITVEDGKNAQSTLSSSSIYISRFDLRLKAEFDGMRKKLIPARIAGKEPFSPLEQRRFTWLLHNYNRTAVSLGLADDGGGNIDVYNPSGKKVVLIQSNKKNEGGMALS